MADNTGTIVGNITRDPELRFTTSGLARASFSVAVNRRWRDRGSNEFKEETSFFNVIAWRDMAEHIAESLRRGARVIVTGRLVQRSWETPQGERRSVVEIQCDEIGPSLRWATAQITKAERVGGGDYGGGSQGGDSQMGSAMPDYGYDDPEEPF